MYNFIYSDWLSTKKGPAGGQKTDSFFLNEKKNLKDDCSCLHLFNMATKNGVKSFLNSQSYFHEPH